MKNGNLKKEFKWFTIFEYEKEEKYLREMHKDGWKFLKVSGLGTYHFEKCTPEDVVYQLDYNKEGIKHKEEYLQMFSDCGWEHLQEFAGYSYFRKPASEMNGEEGIFCDEESKLRMMERVLRVRMTPLVVIFFCFLLPQLCMNSASGNYAVAAFMGGLMAVYLLVFLISARGYFKMKNGRR
jgi:hypothetical protein